MHLSNEVFLERLAELFEARKEKGSVFLTSKRMTYEEPIEATTTEGEDTQMKEDGAEQPTASTSTSSRAEEKEYPLIMRATDGKGKKDIKVKLSTIVQPQDYLSFTEQYTTILRSSLSSSLRPKRKRTAPKSASKSKSKAKSTGTTTTAGGGGGAVVGFRPNLPKVVGPRRGNGRKKRQASQARREKIVSKIRKSREERARRSGQTV
ncbi:hypothetical protein JCM5350_000085 [Sporobolomyces pararoseus]